MLFAQQVKNTFKFFFCFFHLLVYLFSLIGSCIEDWNGKTDAFEVASRSCDWKEAEAEDNDDDSKSNSDIPYLTHDVSNRAKKKKQNAW